MQLRELEDAIERVEGVEDDVLAMIERDPQLIKSGNMLTVLKRLKDALASLKDVRRSLISSGSPAGHWRPHGGRTLSH